jgi:hypothetical protein
LFLSSWSHAQSLVTLYENDFENPADTTCDSNGWGPGSSAGGGTFAADYTTPGNPIAQSETTVNRICIQPTQVAGFYYDPDASAGNYAGSMNSEMLSVVSGWQEAWSLQFDPQGHNNITLNLDWSLIDRMYDPGHYMPANASKTVVARFYRVPKGETFGLTNGGNNATVPYATLNGVLATPFAQDNNFAIVPFPASDYPAKQYTLNWQTQTLNLDLNGQGFQPGDQVAVIYHLPSVVAGDRVHAAFDNLKITASAAAPVPAAAAVPGNALWALAMMALGVLGFGWRQRQRRAAE